MGKIARYVSKLDGTMPDVLDQTLDNVFPPGFEILSNGRVLEVSPWEDLNPSLGGKDTDSQCTRRLTQVLYSCTVENSLSPSPGPGWDSDDNCNIGLTHWIPASNKY